jgi:hypothetical protein
MCEPVVRCPLCGNIIHNAKPGEAEECDYCHDEFYEEERNTKRTFKKTLRKMNKPKD